MNGGGDTPLPTAEITSAQFMNGSGDMVNWPMEVADPNQSSKATSVIVGGTNFVAGNIQLLFITNGESVTEDPVSFTDTEVRWGKLNHAAGMYTLMVNGEKFGENVIIPK